MTPSFVLALFLCGLAALLSLVTVGVTTSSLLHFSDERRSAKDADCALVFSTEEARVPPWPLF